jgi:7-cyano-7-deazaguanine synthase
VCLAWALERFARVETIGFDYRQRHRVELECRGRVLAGIRERFPAWGARLGEDRVLDLGVLGEVSDTALTRDRKIDFEASGLPSTFVPGRNLVFLAFAGAVAYRRGLERLVGGMCETDYSGYPDCRRTTLDAMGEALTLGLDRPTPVETPLMYLDKAATWALADELGGAALVELIVEETHTCYLGDRSHRHAWGYGCGTCPACELRARGWEKWRTSQ